MSWADLTDCKDAIVGFIQRFKTLDDVKVNPIVVPYSVWVKNQDRDNFTDVTASRLAFHWLEHIGYLRLKYLSQAYFSLTIPAGVESSRRDGEQNSIVLDYLKSHAERNDEPSLFSIVDMRTSLRLSVAKIIQIFIKWPRPLAFFAGRFIGWPLSPLEPCAFGSWIPAEKKDN
jgi:ATP-dependent DNA helicase RecQ